MSNIAQKLKNILKDNIFTIFVFASYMFTYMSVLTTLNTKASGLIDPNLQITLYYVDTFLVALGFISYSIYHKITKSDNLPKLLLGVYVVLLIVVIFSNTNNVFVVSEPAASLFNGFLGGYIYYYMSMTLYKNKNAGIVMGISNSIAMIIQYLFMIVLKLSPTIILLIDIAIICGYILLSNEFVIEDNIGTSTEKVENKNLIIACIVLIALTFLNTYYDNIIEKTMVSIQFKTYNIYSWPRLLSCISFIIFGYVYDLYKGRNDNVLIFIAALISVINPIIVYLSKNLNISMMLFYIEFGCVISYLNLTFWDLAPNSNSPYLWASMGRIIDSAFNVIFVLLHIGDISLPVIIILDIVTLIIIYLCLENNKYKTVKEDTSLIEKYNLTEREKEVYDLLVNSEMGVQEMADKLFISRRTLQRHISSIYQKADVSSRAGLIQKIYNR